LDKFWSNWIFLIQCVDAVLGYDSIFNYYNMPKGHVAGGLGGEKFCAREEDACPSPVSKSSAAIGRPCSHGGII
jgi:hypothetical protein